MGVRVWECVCVQEGVLACVHTCVPACLRMYVRNDRERARDDDDDADDGCRK